MHHDSRMKNLIQLSKVDQIVITVMNVLKHKDKIQSV